MDTPYTGEDMEAQKSTENEGNDGNDGNDGNASNASSNMPDDTAPVVYTPLNGDFSPGQEGEQAPMHLMHFQEEELNNSIREHGFFVKRLSEALTTATADHAYTCLCVAKSLARIQRRTLRRLQHGGDGPRYLLDYFEPDPSDPRRMKRRRRSPPSEDREEASRVSSCGPDCSGER